MKCHNLLCENEQFFHLACLNFKRMPNNALTTWQCMGCKSGNKGKLNTKEAEEAKDSLHACKSGNKDVIITGISACRPYLNVSIPCKAGLIVISFMQYMYVLEKLTLELRVYRDQLWAPLIQILHTGEKHWVCVASVGCGDGTVNLPWHHDNLE